MRVLYTARKQWRLEKEGATNYRNLYWDETLHYGELPEDTVITHDNFSDAIKYFEGCSGLPQVYRSLIFDKPYLMFSSLDNIKMSKSTFRPFSVRWHYKRARDDNYSVHELLQKLTVPEFIQYCKDNCQDLQDVIGGIE